MTELVAADIGGTHARFAIAEVADERVIRLDAPMTLRTADHDGLQAAWEQFGRSLGRPLPRAAAIAVASPVGAETIRLTNNDWVLHPAGLDAELGIDRHLLINDFGAVGHAVQHAAADQFAPVCGPDLPLPAIGSITICGPGTGLGVAQLLRTDDGYEVIETEGGHIGFAATDPYEDGLVAGLRARFGRVSAERICAGPGLANLYAALGAEHGQAADVDERTLWDLALAGADARAAAALDRFSQALGGVTGDLALAHGAKAVVIAGGLGVKLKDHLPASGFARRFAAKGRFQAALTGLPVKIITHPQPGLFGVASAFAQRSIGSRSP